MTDHEHRKQILEKYNIQSHKDFMEVIREVNCDFKSRAPKLRRQYVRVYDYPCPRPVGLVIMVDDRFLSFSQCHPNDTFNKELALFYASQRPNYVDTNKNLWWEDIPESLREVATSMVSFVRRTNVD